MHSWVIRSVVWNLFLALIPVGLAYFIAWGTSGTGKQRRVPMAIIVPLVLVWLFFVPNTCYLLTEWRHLLFDKRWEGLLSAGSTDPHAMFATAEWACLFLMYSGLGVLLFALAIRPVEHRLRASGHKFYFYAPLFFFVVSLGVYLGLIVRLNSWDVFHRPGDVWTAADDALTTQRTLAAILVFAGMLWALYEAVDIWVDGVAARLSKLRLAR